MTPVVSQPSLLLDDPGGLEISADDLSSIAKLEREDLTVMAYRFEDDACCRAERFAACPAALGDRLVGRVRARQAVPRALAVEDGCRS